MPCEDNWNRLRCNYDVSSCNSGVLLKAQYLKTRHYIYVHSLRK